MSELYELPDGWEWKKLSDIGKISTGKTPPKANKEFYENGTIRFVKPPNLQNSIDVTKTESDEFITEDGAKKSTLLPKNSLMVCCIGSLGKFALSTENVITNQQINSIVFNNEVINYKYGYYYGFMFEKLLNCVANEAVVKIVNKTIYSNLNIPLPPLSEQQRIVSKLDLLFEKIDKSIALHQKNMDEANAFMGSVLNDVFGELEGKYEKKELKDLVSKLGDGLHGTPKYDENGEYYFINGANVKDNKIVINENTKKVNEEEYLKYKKELTDRTVFVSINGTIGNVGLYNNEKCMLGKSACYFNLLEDIDKIYITYVIQNGEFQQYIEENSTGATIKNVSLKTMRAYKVVLPPLNIQQKVVKYLDEISQKIEKIKQAQKTKMNSLKALKASILDQAFKGEL